MATMLKFTPLEFETLFKFSDNLLFYLLKFTPLEFETNVDNTVR